MGLHSFQHLSLSSQNQLRPHPLFILTSHLSLVVIFPRAYGAFVLLSASIVSALPKRQSAPSNFTFSTVGTVPGAVNLENLAVRHNGDVLVTSIRSNTLFQVSPSRNTTASEVVQIPDVTGLTGIVELEKDVFYVAGTNLTGSSSSPGSNGVWRVDLRNSSIDGNGCVVQVIALSQVADLLSTQLINGLSSLAPNDTSHLLFSDSVAGLVSILDVETGLPEVVVKDPSMNVVPGGLNVGVNGIETYGDRLFFTSLDQHLFASVSISLSTGHAIGPVVPIVNITGSADDFALSRDGRTAFISLNGGNAILEVDIASKSSRYIGSPLLESICLEAEISSDRSHYTSAELSW
ncbi:hypothetical protein D6D03_10214 [Aureobasidium pullulans]|nr:hypothetical protein D6D03_10214 [Aureobasidium pullulans]